MTKLEEKLIELGYAEDKNVSGYYKKYFDYAYIAIYIDKDNTIKYEWSGVQMKKLVRIKSQKHINDLQQAYNEMQKDLEVLRQCYE